MKQPKRDPNELSPTEKAVLDRWRKGPTHLLKDGNRWWRVHYRSRPPGYGGERAWTKGYIDKVCKTRDEAGRHVQQKISQGHRLEVEIIRVEDCGDERPIQTGKPVDVVSEKKFEEIQQKRDLEVAENQEELDDESFQRTTTREWSKPPSSPLYVPDKPLSEDKDEI